MGALVDKARGHCPGTTADVDCQQQLALGVHRTPAPLGRPRQAFDGLGRTAEGKHLIEVHLPDPHVVQDVSGKRPELLCSVDQPLPHGMRLDLEHPCGASDAHTFGQAREDTHDEVDRGALAMQVRAEGRETIAVTGDTQQLPPETATRMVIGAEVPPAPPTALRTGRIGVEMGGGIHLAAASACHDQARW